ncbi:PDZ domain-containing protein [Anatilimnocola sp. NA78]|uniref:PDZ domain-containing protein n=1 Tax=Anatilimnocola sp. NA78 TaxID=3415683 RepID=UPI003CE48E40
MRRTLVRRWLNAAWAVALVPTLVIASSSALVRAEEIPVATAVSPADMSRWVRELDAESYEAREAASNRLIAAGPAAIEHLAPAVLSESAEVAWRASIALQRIAVAGDEETVNHVAGALGKLSVKRPVLGQVIREIKSHQQSFRHSRAIAKVRSLGGQLSGHWQDQPFESSPPPAALDVAVADVIPAVALEPLHLEAAPLDVIPVGDADAVPPAPRGLIGAIARILAPPVKEPAEPAADAVPLEVRPLDVRAIELAPEINPIPGDVPPAAPKLEEPLPIAPPAPPADKLPADITAPEDLPKFEVPKDVEAAAPIVEVVADEIILDIEAPIMIGGGMIGPAVFAGDFTSEDEDYAELVLNRSFHGTDADLAELRDIPELYTLSIDGAKLTDKTLRHIAALPKLTTLNVRGTPFTSAALRELRKQRPSLSLVCRSSAMLGINAGLEGPCILTSVFFRSGAQEAGLKEGDEIIEVEGEKIRDFSDLTIAVYPHQPGDKLSVKYRRDGEDKSVDVVLKPRAGE